MRKLNNKGYMLVEIIMAFAITFALIYFLMDMVINLKNKNDDLLVDTVIKTDQTIISNKLMDYIIEDTSDEGNIEFKCEKIKVEGNSVKYGDNVLGIVDDSATISYDSSINCSNVNGRIHINIPVEIKQMPDKNYDIVVDYRYKLMYCNPTKSYSCANGNAGKEPYAFIYTGNCKVEPDGDKDDWKIKFLTDGTFTSDCEMLIDVFLVGGGGAGGNPDYFPSQTVSGGGGGGGGYVTNSIFKIKAKEPYSIFIGTGGIGGTNPTDGGDTIAFGSYASGGSAGIYGGTGGSGGSGGGAGGSGESGAGGKGGSGGENGDSNSSNPGGVGQGVLTKEFGESAGTSYAGGGGGGGGCSGDAQSCYVGIEAYGGDGGGASGDAAGDGDSAEPNTGGGGGGGGRKQYGKGGNGGSGIVVIRNARKVSELPFEFDYLGEDAYYSYIVENETDWKIKFLTSGTFVPYDDILIDAFLVGGGGGGSKAGQKSPGAGGAGGYTNTTLAMLASNSENKIVIGSGGDGGKSGSGEKGGDTIAFNSFASGGGGSPGNTTGGNGGSGGGGGYGGDGGSNGASGSGGVFGIGQIKSTCEFGETPCDVKQLYSGGGGGGAGYEGAGGRGTGGGGGGASGSRGLNGASALKNSGGGGGGGGSRGFGSGGNGGSGIVVIRNARKVSELPFEFDYLGEDAYYSYIAESDIDWKIKFLTSGTFIPKEDIVIDAFLVGGGGGGSKGVYTGGGGGGGGYTSTNVKEITKNGEYEIIIGKGGEGSISSTVAGETGGTTKAFDFSVNGGGGGNGTGGNGGSGGGGGGEVYSEWSYSSGGAGGSNGDNGKKGHFNGGVGQFASSNVNTREFGEPDGFLYAGGGGGGGGYRKATGPTGSGKGGDGGAGSGGGDTAFDGLDAIINSGGGGGGGHGGNGYGGAGGDGGSGIVVIRKAT